MQQVQNEVGYDPGQRARNRIALKRAFDTEIQLGYAPGLGMFGVPIAKSRKQKDLSFLGNKWGDVGRKKLEDLPRLISPKKPLEKLSPLKFQKRKYLDKIEKKMNMGGE